MTSFMKTTADYGLSNVCCDPVKVVTIEGNHVSILETDELAEPINRCLESRNQDQKGETEVLSNSIQDETSCDREHFS
ncbi:hypothetical protein QE152_g5965 [Popillia japonica]|uniref:Uncharacterized protein n=1 Tax=Popillia japonica TaxID=7064 RepID=A0AAW1MGV8_POPJA